jgi:peptidoglycan/xylan/chitin deacetylase (PgdA/CDA1 family)
MLHGGIHVGAHTRTHVLLTELSADRVKEEVEGSRMDLERQLGLPVLTFTYPYGEYNTVTQAMVEQAGFACPCRITPGMNCPATPVSQLRRTEIYGTDSLVGLALSVLFGQNPLRAWHRKRHAVAGDQRISAKAGVLR